ncbi:MAG: SulP family inorganic anion transporter, partial [Nitrospirota bacterium]
NPVLDALVLGVVSLTIVYATPERVGKIIPPPLLALVIGTVLGVLVFPGAPVIGAIPTTIPMPVFPTLHLDAVKIVIGQAIVLAVLGSIDSLLTSLVCDNLTRTHHDSNRELIGQGIGNAVAGLFGGLPGAGATMRSVINIRTGGRTPISGALHALILLAVLLGLGPLAERIPLAVLAGILVKVGVDIIDWRLLKHVMQAPRADVTIMAVVCAMTVLADLIMAVAVGLVLASVLFVKRMADLELMNLRIITAQTPESPLTNEEAAVLSRHEGRIILIHIDGPMSFGSAKDMVRRLEGVSRWNSFAVVVLDLSAVPTIDGTAALAVEDMIHMAASHHQHLVLVGMQPTVTEVLEGLGVLRLVPSGHHHISRLDALHHAARLVTSSVS